MANEKNGIKKSTKRKAVSQAISKQDNENVRYLLSAEEIQDAIRLKAYELYLERAGGQGNDVEDWTNAERIILKNIR